MLSPWTDRHEKEVIHDGMIEVNSPSSSQKERFTFSQTSAKDMYSNWVEAHLNYIITLLRDGTESYEICAASF